MTDEIEMIVCPLKETGPGNHRNSEGAIIELNDGRLLLAYTHFYENADDVAPADIQGKLSEDGGRTWTPPFQIRPNNARYNAGRLGLLKLGGENLGEQRSIPSEIALIYVNLERPCQNALYFTTSRDGGANWSREVTINPLPTYDMLCQRGDTPLVLKSGRIVVPVYAALGDLCASFMFLSDDHGVTWHRGTGEIAIRIKQGARTVAFTHFEEPAVAPLRDGRLLCLGRNMTGRFYQSVSEDEGETWSEAEPTDLATSYSPCSLKTIPATGDLLCVWNQASAEEIMIGLGRMRISAAVSTDDGKTWSHFKNIESLDDRARIDPPTTGEMTDAVSEQYVIGGRMALVGKGTTPEQPPEVAARYPRWPGYIHNDYPSVGFTSDDRVMIIYGADDWQRTNLLSGLKLRILPVDWFYK